MKKVISILLVLVSLSSCLILSGCGETHEEWHQRQIQKGMRDAKKQLGR